MCLPASAFAITQSNTNGLLKPDGTSGSGGALEWDGVSVGSTLSGALREAANDSTVAGSRSGALLAVSSSTIFPFFFFPPSASLSVRSMFPVVWWKL